MFKVFCFTLLGYLSGSVLYADVFAKILKKEDILECSKDRNPGTANAFLFGGFWCGILTLAGDLLKGALPVHMYLNNAGKPSVSALELALVLAAPVIGHIFPVFYRFQGGKGIATTLGCLIGLLPIWQPLVIMAACFIFFSLVLQVSPHFYRTVVAYLCTLAILTFFNINAGIWFGFVLITGAVCMGLHRSDEIREHMRVKWLWMR